MSLTKEQKEAYLLSAGFVKATLYETADMIIDPSKTFKILEVIMLPSKAIDGLEDFHQVTAYRIGTVYKNASSEIIGRKIEITETLPDWAAGTAGYQEFTDDTDPTASLAQEYFFKISVDGVACTGDDDGNLSVDLGANETLANIATALATAINTDFEAAVVSAEVNGVSGKVRVISTTLGADSKISISAPAGGAASLLTLLTGVDAAIDGIGYLSEIMA